MPRALVLLSVIDLAVTIFAVVDIITIDPSRVRGLPKFAWIILTLITSFIGAVLWFVIGREPIEPRSHGRYGEPMQPTRSPSRRGPVAPDDDTEFLGKLSREAEQEERIRQLEKRLAELDDDKPKD